MAFGDYFNDRAGNILSRFGQSITYYSAPDAAGTSLTASVGTERVEEFIRDSGIVEKRRARTVWFSNDAAGVFGGIAEPDPKGQVEIDSERWEVENLESATDGYFSLVISRPEADEKTELSDFFREA